MKLAPYLSVQIPTPIKIVLPSKNFPYPFSIYKWLPGKSINLLTLNTEEIIQLAFDLSGFLKELQNVRDLDGPVSGNLNWWRGYNISVYYKAAQKQILELASIINSNKAINLLKRACTTKWNKAHVWIHGDFAIGNILVQNNKLSAVIDFGCSAIGDPACNLVIAWTYLSEKAREVFINEMNLDENTWLRAKAWALWKASFELYKIENKNSSKAKLQKKLSMKD